MKLSRFAACVVAGLAFGSVSARATEKEESLTAREKAQLKAEHDALGRELWLCKFYILESARISAEMQPSMNNFRGYLEKSDASILPYSMWQPTLDNLEKFARKFKANRFVPSTMLVARSHEVEFATNLLHHIRLVRTFARSTDKHYLIRGEPYANAAVHHFVLMNREYRRIWTKITPMLGQVIEEVEGQREKRKGRAA
jgi:hypothetical protein